jgi:methyl-accepting chemotaxis protein
MKTQDAGKKSSSHRLSLEAGAASFVGSALAGGAGLALFSFGGSILLASAGVVAAAAALGAWSLHRSRSNLAVIDEIEHAADSLAHGESLRRLGDQHESRAFSKISQSFNHIFDSLGDTAQRVLGVVHSVEMLPDEINQATAKIEASADAQEEAVEETASLLANIKSSMHDINEKIEKLQLSADESASSVLQMGSSVDEVARNAATLHESVEASASSVHEMGASIRQVADGSEQVERIAEETAASMVEMDRVVQEVSGHAREASGLTQKVSEGAERGSQAVHDTISDIEQIRSRTSEARDTLGQLVSRISEIDSILSVIGEINDETNLLSLNAAIIAAQAGEQGKAFLVVANHVKTLARRTASSTKDIEGLVQSIQHESGDAVKAMSGGIDAIEQGVTRSRIAGQALADILTSSREAYQRVEGIARATDEQSRSSKLVSQAAQDTSSQVRQISAAMAEQTKVSEAMLQNAETALDMCRHVHRSTDEQRETGRYITESISSITDMIRLIRENASSHAQASESVSDAVTRLLDNAQQAGEQVPGIKAMLSQLADSAEVIVEALSRFETVDVGFDTAGAAFDLEDDDDHHQDGDDYDGDGNGDDDDDGEDERDDERDDEDGRLV